MFHVKQRIFIRTDLSIPGAGTVINIAHLEEIDRTHCTMVRMIELDPQESIRGATSNGRTVGQANQPQRIVPHPDTYHQFPDISSRRLSEEEFEALWNEATAKFPELG